MDKSPSLATTDVAIVGSGIVGLSCAFHLQQAGYHCTLIDPLGFGEAASFGNAGMVTCGDIFPQSTPGIVLKGLKMLFDKEAPLKLDYGAWPIWLNWVLRFVYNGGASRVGALMDALHAIQTASRQAWLDMAEAIDARDLVAENGYLYVYSDPASIPGCAWERQMMTQRKVPFQVLDGKELHSLEPSLGKGFVEGMFQPSSLSVKSPGQLCQRLGDYLVQRGVNVHRARLAQIEKQAGDYRLLTDRGTVLAKHVVVAAGVWSRDLLKAQGVSLPVIPGRGYHLMYPENGLTVNRPVLWAERYMVVAPMTTGLRMTSLKELTRIGSAPNYSLIQRRHVDAQRLFPGLWRQPVSQWYGYRPVTPDSLPIIDRLPNENLYIATGHGHFGLTQGPITGKLITQQITNTTPDIPLEPYRYSRFT